MKTIVVGNAPIYPKGLGRLINSFDIVIRINDYVIDGYENDVGNKTDIWFFTYLYWNKFKDLISDYPQAWVLTIDETDYVNVKKIPIAIAQKDLRFPSTGMTAIYAALKEFGSPIHIIGFNGFDQSKDHHYFKDKIKRGRNAHDGKKEMQIIKSMVDSGDLIEFKLKPKIFL